MRSLQLVERFWAKVDKSGGPDACWLWTAGRSDWGYGHFRVGSKNLQAHRFAWELTRGPIPAGLLVLHRCDNPPCCNSAHHFLGTHADNMADAKAKGRLRNPQAEKTHCKRGHPLTPDNVYEAPAGKTVRACKTCAREKAHRQHEAEIDVSIDLCLLMSDGDPVEAERWAAWLRADGVRVPAHRLAQALEALQ